MKTIIIDEPLMLRLFGDECRVDALQRYAAYGYPRKPYKRDKLLTVINKTIAE